VISFFFYFAVFRHDLSEDDYVEFSKQIQDRIIGTKDGVASVSSVLMDCAVKFRIISRIVLGLF
jgi:predicted metal-binding transcription factor (methanogenesis marker protein 9)